MRTSAKGLLAVLGLLLALVALRLLGGNRVEGIAARQLYALRLHPLALPLLTQAAKAGNGEAALFLGSIYEYGRVGLAKDEAQAAAWYRKAAEEGSPDGMRNLASQYEEGQGGLQKDLEEAANWYRRAAERGDQRSADALKRLGKR